MSKKPLHRSRNHSVPNMGNIPWSELNARGLFTKTQAKKQKVKINLEDVIGQVWCADFYANLYPSDDYYLREKFLAEEEPQPTQPKKVKKI